MQKINRILVPLLVAALIMQLPVTALATSAGESVRDSGITGAGGEIIAFDTLPEETANRTVALDTSLEDLNLPNTLNAEPLEIIVTVGETLPTLSVAAFAATADYEFDAATGTLTIKSDAATACDSTTGQPLSTNWRKDTTIKLTDVKTVTIQNGVTSIGHFAFEDCKSLTSVTIPNSVISFGHGAFRRCKAITSMTIPNSVTSIGNYAFEGCSLLTSVTISTSVTSLGYSMFNSCTSLTSVTIPNSVTDIGDYAFGGCTALAIMFTSATPPTFGTGWASYVPTVYYPAAWSSPPSNYSGNAYAIIDIAAIGGVTAPVQGATPVNAITETAQYTGMITWDPMDSNFKVNTVYTATITLTPKTGYTLANTTANFFTVSGATATNVANSGVITAVFPTTGGAPVTVHDVNNAEELGAALDKVTDGTWAAHTIKLTADITYPHPITLVDNDLKLDLDNYTLTVQPSSDSPPNINPMSDKAETAAINLNGSDVIVARGSGSLSVIAGQGIDYGVYAHASEITVNDITCTGGGTAAYVIKDGDITAENISAEGENAHAIMNFGGNVHAKDIVTANGKSSCGVYADSSDGINAMIQIDGDLTVDGDDSRGASLRAEKTYMELAGSVTVTGNNACGVTASEGDYTDIYMAWIGGDVTAPGVAVNASAGAGVRVSGNVSSMDEGTSAIYAAGGSVAVDGNVTSTGINGTAISASKDLINPAAGAFVMVDGKITAYTPLRIESLPVGENEHTGQTAVFGHYVYTDGTNTVWANKNSFVSTNPNAQAPSIIVHPQGGTVGKGDTVTLSVAAKVTDGGMLSYQWYSNTVDDIAGATLISGAQDNVYYPPTDTLGTRYYYVIVTNTNESKAPGKTTATAISTVAAVTVRSGGDNSGGGSTVTQPTVPAANGAVQVSYTSSNGTATLSLPTGKVNEIIETSKSGEAILDLSEVSGTTAIQIPKDALTAFTKGGLDTVIKLPVGTITLDKDATASVAQQANSSNVSIELKQAAASSLTDEQKKSVKSGDIVLNINITSGAKKISTFDGTITVQIPYTGPQPVAMWYLNDKGDLEKFNCTFKNGVVSFDLDHLSLYVVGQDTAKPEWVNPFTDVKEANWFYAAVSFCAEKGITNGASATTFSPNATLTRGQFITMLLKAYGIEPMANPSDNFADAGSTYYTSYLATAKAKGISNGVGDNKFAPEKAITRQEMFTLLYNALKVLNKLPTTDNGKTLADFTDSSDVASWATESMTALIKSGTISGSGSKLDPTGSSTRAQMVQVLYNLLGK